jgi:hypothetical protein
MLSNPERRRSVQADDVVNVISAMNWVWGGLVALLVIAMPLVLILVSHLFDEADRTTYEPILWGIVFLPALIVFVIQLAIANLMAPKIGFDMIQERSPTVSMREAMRSNLTNMALVSALFLTVVYAMLQIPALSENSYSMLSQWYICLLAISCMQMTISIMTSVICLLYTEPLSEQASILAISNNLMQFGEPATQSMMGFFNTMCAMVLWIHEGYGFVAALMTVLTVFYGVTRVVVNQIYLSSFRNPDIDAATRQDRDKWKNAAATVGNGVAVTTVHHSIRT